MISIKSFIHPLCLDKPASYVGRRNRPEPCKKYVKVSHCIFDLDGTILDNHKILDNAYKMVFEKYKEEYTREWSLKLIGMTEKALWEKVIMELRLKTRWEKMNEEYTRIIKGPQLGAPLRPGVERLMEHLQSYAVPMAAVTSSTKATMEARTSHILKTMSMFSHVVCGGDDVHVEKSKPSPDIYTICALRFLGKPEPQTCLVFEDSPIGVAAALDACMQVVGVPCPPTPFMSLRHANEVMKTLKDFWPGKYGLPPFPDQKNRMPPPP